MSTGRLSWAQTYPVTVFYLLAFLISWLGWLPSLLASQGMGFFAHPYWTVSLLLPALGPTLAAKLTLTWQGQVSIPLTSLFRRPPLNWWYILAVVSPWVVQNQFH